MDIEIEESVNTSDLPKPDNDGKVFGLNLGDYSEPKQVVSDTPIDNPINQINTENPSDPINPTNPSSDWRNNPDFYQTGKKAGQPRPNRLNATYNRNASTTIPSSVLVNGAMFMGFINFVIPLIMVTANNWLSPKEKMEQKDLRLTNEDRKDIDPLMDATLKQLNIQGNPALLLAIALVGAYSMKFFNKKMAIGIEKDEPKKETK